MSARTESVRAADLVLQMRKPSDVAVEGLS
jgi:hypothetical protein